MTFNNIQFIQTVIIILDYVKCSDANFKTPGKHYNLNDTLNIRNDPNVKLITIGYIAGIELRPNSSLRTYDRTGRYLSGALTCAINKLNTMARENDTESLLPYDYQINLQFVETFGELKRTIQAVANMSIERNVWAIFGLQESCRTQADIAAAYNILIISHFCADNILTEDYKRYSTYIRTRPQLSGLAKSLVGFLEKLKWTGVTLVASNHRETKFLLQNCVDALEENKIRIIHKEIYRGPAIHGSANNEIINVVERTFRSSKIYVFFGSDFEVIALLMNLYERGLTDTGNYFVIYVMIRSQSINENFLNNNRKFRISMRNFVIISHIKPEGEHVDSIKEKIKEFINLPPFNAKKTMDNISYIPIEASYLYDAVWLYATALGKVLRNPTLGSPRDGKLLKGLLLNYDYKSVFGYMNRIDDRGGACGNYTVNQIVVNANDTVKIETIGLFRSGKNNSLIFEFLKNKKINWVNNIPVVMSACGINGELCNKKEQVLLIAACFFIVIFVGIFISAFIIRNRKYEKELERLLWKIDKNKEIDLMNPKLLEKCSFITRPPFEEDENGRVYLPSEEDKNPFIIANSCCNIGIIPMSDWSNSNMLLAVYKNQEVFIKRIFFSNTLSITRKVKKELKTLRAISYMNLNKFMGTIIEHQDTWVIWDFCDRGSLQDVLYSTKLTKDYPLFLSSFAFDVIRGLVFLHENPDIGFHGQLKSSNCLVDSRWTVKLTDYGMTEFLTYRQPAPDTHEYIYFLSLFWTAPEILRNLIQHKYHSNPFIDDFKQKLVSERKRSNDKRYEEHFTNFSNDKSCQESFIKSAYPSISGELDLCAYQKGDIYSFGMIFYELHSCQIPFLSNYSTQNSPKEIIRRLIVLNDQFKVPYRPKLSLISNSDNKIVDLIKLSWQENSNQRPSAKVIHTRLKVIFGDKRNLVECMREKMILYTKNLEKEVMKRTEELREEKKQNEELLYQMLPIPVAQQLRQHKQVEAEAFDCVSIYFSDIVGFTELAGSCSPFEVVNLLNQLYTSFDNIIDNFNVYKVETIGDSYMVVSGLPTQFDGHAKEMANMSLRLLEEITKGFVIPSKKHENETLKLRIGLHSGPCCAGVVGTRNPRYCLFGDTVNMASRMESTGEALKIHCSEAFIMQILHLNTFHIVERGVIEVKGKGFVNTFWLLGKTKTSVSTQSVRVPELQKIDKVMETSADCKNSEKLLKGKQKNNFFEKMKENTYKSKFNHKKTY